MSKVIVFGANGYLGRHICRFLSEKGDVVFPLGSKEVSVDNLEDYEKLDITDSSNDLETKLDAVAISGVAISQVSAIVDCPQ